MKFVELIMIFIGCGMMMASCAQSSDNTQRTTSVEEDRPPLEYTDADRTFSVVLEISSDSLLTCNNNFLGIDDNPLILDTSNPGFPDFLSNWFATMDSVQINRLKSGRELHISVGDSVADATVEKIKHNVMKCGIRGISISNF